MPGRSEATELTGATRQWSPASVTRGIVVTTALIAVAWTAAVGTSLAWNIAREHRQALSLARTEARANYDKDLAFRLWATSHGGVYVPPDARTPPNPALAHHPERDVVTTTGKQLTLMNPAYMLRQMMDEFSELYGSQGHITSFKPLNPANAPDAWERKALRAFEQGAEELFEVTEMDGAPHIRLMRPMITREGCLPCHAQQGYKVGDIRGGVGVSLPLEPFFAQRRAMVWSLAFSHAGIWLIGCIATVTAGAWRLRHAKDRLRAASVLHAQQERVQLALEGGDLGLWDWNIATGGVEYNARWADMLGLTLDHVEPSISAWEHLVHPDDLPQVRMALDAHMRGETDGYESEHRLRHAAGHWVWVLAKGRVIERTADGTPLRACGTHLDITERKQAEVARARAQEFLQTVIDGLPEAVLVIDPDYQIQQANLAARSLGNGNDSMQPQGACYELSHHKTEPCNSTDCTCPLRTVVKTGQSVVVEHTHYAPDGTEIFVEIVAAPIFDAAGNVVQIIESIRDITTRKRAEDDRLTLQQQVQHTQKLESLGVLAGGIAHDFNNLLTGILGNAELAELDVAPDARVSKHIAAIRKSATHAAELTRQMLAYSGKGRFVVEPLDLARLVQDIAPLLDAALPKGSRSTPISLRICRRLKRTWRKCARSS